VAPTASSAAPSPERRVEQWLAKMTLEEKIDYVGGDRDFFIRAVASLGIPEIKMSDGPSGCRNWGPSTAYPAAIALAASFDSSLAERVGQSIARDCRARGVRILLAPGVNIQRSPLNGRNFEYLGEDPFLAGTTAAAYVRGVQGEGVVATVKHFAANNQEWDRRGISSEVDERSLREIYLPAFERTVRGGTWAP
jgi:beta-glucosidase